MKNYIKQKDKQHFMDYCKDKTSDQICKHFGINITTFRSRVRRWNVKYKKRAVSSQFNNPRVINNLRQLAQHKNKAQLCMHYSCPMYVMERVLKHYKISTADHIYVDLYSASNAYCKTLGYKSAYDYIDKNGALAFRQKIKPKLK